MELPCTFSPALLQPPIRLAGAVFCGREFFALRAQVGRRGGGDGGKLYNEQRRNVTKARNLLTNRMFLVFASYALFAFSLTFSIAAANARSHLSFLLSLRQLTTSFLMFRRLD